jgi:alkanesulfonate monooxygenase SsuD/methylene tetrahydromethanopterin reductase-like flavin-dependent oxidoreductase (luciferase family)
VRPRLRFGINISGIFPKAANFPVTLFAETAMEAERLGYDGFFIPDHLNLPWSQETAEPWTTLAYIAAKTERIRLGSIVTPLPRYVPAQLAKLVAHLDILSGGRAIVGIGAGWHPPEFLTYSPEGAWDLPNVRVAKTLEGVQLMVKLWTEEKASFRGKYYRVEDGVLEPKPVSKPHPPVWSGGSGEYMLKMTAKYFDGWVPTNWRWTNSGDVKAENYRRQVAKIRDYARKYRRDPSGFTFAVEGGIGDSAELVEAYRDAGCEYYIAFIGLNIPSNNYPFRYKPEQYIALTRKFADEVVSSFKKA